MSEMDAIMNFSANARQVPKREGRGMHYVMYIPTNDEHMKNEAGITATNIILCWKI